MAVFNYVHNIPSVLLPNKVFNAFQNSYLLIPKVAPQVVKSVEIDSGDGGPGTILKITYADGNPFKHATHRIDAIDRDNLKYSYSVIGGGPLGDKLEKISTDFAIVNAPPDGSSLTITGVYYTKDNSTISPEELNVAKEQAEKLFRLVEAYVRK